MDYLQYFTFQLFRGAMQVGSVLNLIINGLPSIPEVEYYGRYVPEGVLNLIINGLPSIPKINTDFYFSI